MKKSILYIFVVLMALSLTLGAVSAEDAVAADDAVAAEVAVDEAPATEGEAAGGDVPVADVEVDVELVNETDYTAEWGVLAVNNGPDTAYDTVVRIAGSDNLYVYDVYVSAGQYYPEFGLWYIGDIPADQYAVLLLETIKVDAWLGEGNGPYYVEALITTESFDPDLSNNYDIAWAGLDTSAAKETLPETGNPLAMALLALCAIGIGGIKRRF